ncbi:MAG: desulfoferrodoxin [Candidatus Nealsonbacteria bacterium RIFCSPLOWO2_01_FULL_43_32]|uniref:Desulfoferrodoxin n=1 Tax=Candidatus Nealsonbacteria bacterium RIFCSPLOWO2_01_FULL_43_32 TaxID=1801672 RepID=A0A1G2EG63_9BACT|nr:MAG: desulfoferrodoxin [Candidatus Nealsonbacteria bacterium RIFCSPLOWO2_01_FULL_43_32]
MTQLKQIYKCSVCGNIVEVIHASGGELVCCGKPMELLQEKTEDQGYEKHVPVIERTEQGILVKVGSIPHPMEEVHYIEWIEIIADGRSCRKFLKPGDKPEALFTVTAQEVIAREYCNLHGLWKG